ncbi:guanine nucleotide binding protein, alpha subunit [Pisolithus microcarpus]|nr:guanine nucleotide binding protein, alpha subunit [Pisolithus microcarpus]
MVRVSLDDPLALALSPPPNETPEQRSAREQAEAEARKTSEAIDEQIRQEKIALKKKKKPVKILLLGQSESGKSATLKNFQLQYAKDQWLEERLAWRAVIYLNLIKNALQVLDILQQAMSQTNKDKYPSTSLTTADISDSDGEHRSHTTVYRFTDKHRLLKLRLAPLRTVLVDLEKRLGPGSQEVHAISRSLSDSTENRARQREFGVSSNNGWKSILDKLRSTPEPGNRPSSKQREAGHDGVTDVLLGCKDDMKSLWHDPVVKQILSHRRSKIEDASGFFLDDVDRIASPDYEPADDDIVRARLRTVGVQEHSFMMEADRGREWIMYDFGGTRSARALWAAFFDDVDTIIFLAPISCFDERLREDQDVNRLEDSLQLWRIVCSSPVLAKAQIILFLNKCDILHKKMKRGVSVRDYVPSFADRKNDTMTVMKYFQQHFKDLFKSCSPEPRPFFVHFTSVIDTKATATTLSVVRESVLRQHLQNARLI